MLQELWLATVTRSDAVSNFLGNGSRPDVLRDVQQAWDGFVSSGQAWAALFGLAIGYFVAKFTSYG